MQRILLFAFVILCGVSCERDPENNGVLYDNVNSAFAARIDTVVYAFNTAQTPYVGTSSFDAVFNEPDSANTAKYSTQIFVPTSLRPSVLIRKGSLYFSDTLPSDSLFEAFFQPGEFNYSQSAFSGFEILWIDMNGELWSTSAMSGDQTGHYFRITNCRSFRDASNNIGVKFRAEFSCTLYHPTLPAMQLTDGLYEGIVKKQ